MTFVNDSIPIAFANCTQDANVANDSKLIIAKICFLGDDDDDDDVDDDKFENVLEPNDTASKQPNEQMDATCADIAEEQSYN